MPHLEAWQAASHSHCTSKNKYYKIGAESCWETDAENNVLLTLGYAYLKILLQLMPVGQIYTFYEYGKYWAYKHF